MQSIDYQFKDAQPVDTVKRIQDILSKYGISVTENPGNSGVKNCYSSRLTIDGTKLGTNGKGITPEFCRASAHAEMMERLQSGFLKLSGGLLEYTDSIEVDRDGLIEHCDKWLDALSAVAFTSEGEHLTKENLIDSTFQLDKPDKTSLLPFYDVTTQSRTYYPLSLIAPLYGSNGLAAGNTSEEALVQGFSEIVERHNREKFLCGDIVPPNIPEDYLKQFPTAYETICDIRNSGYDVYVKDCSLGEPFPLIATVLIDRKTHGYHVHMGASPVFEIALERSLTEMFQGRTIAKIAGMASLYMGKKGQRRSAEDIHHVHVYGQISYPLSFFSGEPSYEFKPFPDCRGKDNKTLLREILDYLKQHNKHLLIRDLSHMGFPTFRLIVPSMSEINFDGLTQKFPFVKLSNESVQVFANVKEAALEQLLSVNLLAKYRYTHLKVQQFSFTALSHIPLQLDSSFDLFLGLMHFAYVEWALGSPKQALSYAKKAMPYTEDQSVSSYLDCLCRVFSFATQGYSTLQALEDLQPFYLEETLSAVREVLTKNENPFSRFAFVCNNSHCPSCSYADRCFYNARKRVLGILNQAVSAFDNEAAFQKIDVLFKNL